VAFLLANKANANAATKDGRTALYIAAKNGHESVVAVLLANNANINATNSAGNTALIAAAERGYMLMVKILLEKGANIDSVNKDGRKAIDVATGSIGALLEIYNPQEHAAAIAAVAQQNQNLPAEVRTTNALEKVTADAALMTPIQLRLLRGVEEGDEIEVALCLDVEVDLEAQDSEGNTPLLVAARDGHQAILAILLDKGANIEAINDKGTALILAAMGYHHLVLVTLLERGANIEAKDRFGDTALRHAVRQCNLLVVETLLEKRADIEVVSFDLLGHTNLLGQTVLMIAADKGYQVLVKMLLDKKANIEAVARGLHREGSTALMFAAGSGHYLTVEILLEYNAAVNFANKRGETALILAAKEGHKLVVEILLNKGAEIEAVYYNWNQSCWENAIDVAKTEEIQLIIRNAREVSFYCNHFLSLKSYFKLYVCVCFVSHSHVMIFFS
jgi:ankyrin repeat protein